ncbi:hypothetical protein DPEC_G00058280 [Dallia pectoralis]|uniref:Uncharacterized protein n=1 Tax=Dallia pectoralis TaxID=75939 RepID=A0ACC2H661_DALPE|nr:hypothetical protein DPEC_G00058280 [Dallia pectoralis]
MSTALETTGFLLGVASWLITGASLGNDYWKISSVSGSVVINIRQYENLWHSCAKSSTGVAECRDFQSLLDLPGHIQASRALMIIALLLGLASMVISLLGLKCIKIGKATSETKGKITVVGGVLFILAGLCVMICCSWYAARIVQEFNNPMFGGTSFELGTGLFMGWGGASLAILGGLLLTCACKRAQSDKPKSGYNPANHSKPMYSLGTKSEPEGRAYV